MSTTPQAFLVPNLYPPSLSIEASFFCPQSGVSSPLLADSLPIAILNPFSHSPPIAPSWQKPPSDSLLTMLSTNKSAGNRDAGHCSSVHSVVCATQTRQHVLCIRVAYNELKSIITMADDVVTAARQNRGVNKSVSIASLP